MAGRTTLYMVIFLAITISKSFFINADLEWDTLRITYGKFSKMPLTRTEAESKNFVQIGGKEAPCEGIFSGYRYAKNNDPSVILLYDANGYFAGTQTSFPEHTIKKIESLNWFKQNPMFTVEELPLKNNKSKAYTLTAYLVDPTNICSTGRTEKQFKDSVGGTNLYFKNGTENVAIPKQQTDIKGTSWTLGKCFPLMGDHYWYNTSKGMNCDYFQPVFLLYNRGKLIGFGWAVVGYFPSSRYEHPPKFSFGAFFEQVPDCVLSTYGKANGYSTQHVYMHAPWTMLC